MFCFHRLKNLAGALKTGPVSASAAKSAAKLWGFLLLAKSLDGEPSEICSRDLHRLMRAIDAHADRMIRHLAIEIDATTEQQDKLRTIVQAAVKDLLGIVAQNQRRSRADTTENTAK